MPDLNIDLNFFDHPKTKRLVGLLGRGSEVLPLKLWAYTGKVRAEDGRLVGHAAQEIESIAGWWGKQGEMIEAMLRDGTRFLDREEDGTFVIHDWLEHQGHLAAYKIRGRKAAKKRWESMAGQSLDATSMPQAMLDACHKQCPIPSNQPTEDPPGPPDGGKDVLPGFDAFWEAYPNYHNRRVAKKRCRKKWKSEKLEAITGDVLLGLEGWKKHWAKDGYRFLCHPHTFLNEEWWPAAAGDARPPAPKSMTDADKRHRAWLAFTPQERRELLPIVKDSYRKNPKAMLEIEALVQKGGVPADWLLNAFVEAREASRDINGDAYAKAPQTDVSANAKAGGEDAGRGDSIAAA